MSESDRTPREEIAKRTAEAGAGMVAAAKGIALDQMWQSQEAYQNRVNDSHALGQKLLGEEPMKRKAEGNRSLVITGDINASNAGEVPGIIAGLTGQPVQPKPKSLLRKLAVPTLLTLGALGAGGLGFSLPFIMDKLKPDQYNTYDIRKWIPGEEGSTDVPTTGTNPNP